MAFASATPFQSTLTHILETRNALANDAAIGKPKSWEAYQNLIGQIRALDDVLDKMREITGNPEATDEKDM